MELGMSDSDKQENARGFFRCPVQPEDAKATISIRRTRIPAIVQDRSIDGFSVLIAPKYVSKLKVDSQWTLNSKDEVTEVWAQWMFRSPDGHAQLGLRRLRDMTPQDQGSYFPTLSAYRKHTTNPELLMAAMVLTAFLALSLPGVGDQLGTSGKIQTGLQVLCEVVRDGVGYFW
jgi:hypothetical protein